jgi:putative ABC transport system ATP-binding protein
MSVTFRNVSQARTRPGGERLQILDDISFSVERASRVAIIGPSGGGKTTLMRLINRLDDPDSGQILLNDVDVRELFAPDLRRRVGMVFQQPFLSEGSVRENLNRPLSLARQAGLATPDLETALRRVGLPVNILDAHTRDLSVGQQQRVAIARALVLQPEVLLLDEPTSALDPRSADLIIQLLVDLSESLEITVVMVSHTLEQAAKFATSVLAVRDGEVNLFDNVDDAARWSMPVGVEEEVSTGDA